MTLTKNPSLSKQTKLLKYKPKINVIDGIKLVCERIQNHK